MQRMSEVKHAYILFEFDWNAVNSYPRSARVPSHVRKKIKNTGCLYQESYSYSKR